MMEQRQGLEWIPSCQRSLRLKCGCTKDLCCNLVMSLYDGAKTRVRVDSELSEEFEAKVWMHQGSVL